MSFTECRARFASLSFPYFASTKGANEPGKQKESIIDHIPVIVMSHIPPSETYEKIKILTFPLLLEKSIF